MKTIRFLILAVTVLALPAAAQKVSDLVRTNVVPSGTLIPVSVPVAGGYASRAVDIVNMTTITNKEVIALASNTNATFGGLSSNLFGYLNAAPGAVARFYDHPRIRYNPWNVFGSSGTEAQYKALIDTIYTNGLVRPGQTYVSLTDGWQGGRTNGVLYPNGTKFPGWTNLFGYAHARGILIDIYTEPLMTTSAGFTGSGGPAAAVTNAYGKFTRGGDYLEDDARLFLSWGADGFQFDVTSADKEFVVYAVQKFSAGLRANTATRYRPVHLYTSGLVSDAYSTNRYDWIVSSCNSFRVHTDASGEASDGGAWTNNLDRIDRNYAALHWTGQGVYLDSESSQIQLPASGYYNSSRGFVLWCFAAPLNITPATVETSTPQTMNMHTNRMLYSIWNDALQQRLVSVFSNSTQQIFAADLTAGKKKVFTLNRQRDTATTIIPTWAMLGYNSNQIVKVENAGLESVVGNYSGAWSTVVASNTSDVFILTPIFPVTNTIPFNSCLLGSSTATRTYYGSYLDEITAQATDANDLLLFVPVPKGSTTAIIRTLARRTNPDYTTLAVQTAYESGAGITYGAAQNFVMSGTTNLVVTGQFSIPVVTNQVYIRMSNPQGTNTSGARAWANSIDMVAW